MRRGLLALVLLVGCTKAHESGTSKTEPEPKKTREAPSAVDVEPTPAEPEPATPAIVPSEILRPAVQPISDAEMARIVAARADERDEMVRLTIEPTVRDARVLAAMRAVPREEFVPDPSRGYAYVDGPLSIGYDVTISQPAVVARMTELLQLKPGDKVLEVGTGSGYQAAVLDELEAEVYSIEIIEPLAREAAARLARLGYERVRVRYGDGYAGWPEHAPFAGIVVTAAPPAIPEPLKQQLAVGGRLVIPVGRDWQDLVVVTRTRRGFREEKVIPVRFVPMTGEAENLDEKPPR
jgi:protein-L-isoaspartate(D-aspartate) O-methyltransferase